MKTKDRLKEEIGLSKLLFTMLSAIDISLFATAWNNKNVVFDINAILIYFAILLCSTASILIFIFINSKINELDEYV